MSPPRTDRSARGARTTGRPPFEALIRRERLCVAVVISLHLVLAIWGAAKNSVTFDENFHLPAGVMIAASGDFSVSPVNPPLIKTLAALPALAAGARLPDSAAVATHSQWVVGESFMRRNADRYHRVFLAGRLVVALVSAGLGLLVWRFARRMHGPLAGLLALAFYAFSAEALAHSGVVSMDVATGFVMTAALYRFWIFTRTRRWRDWAWTALALGAAALTRFTCALLGPAFLLLALLMTFARRPRFGRVWLGLAMFVPSTLVILNLGYLGQASFRPLSERKLVSNTFQSLQERMPGLRLPLPDSYVTGIDIQSREGQGSTPWYLLGEIRTGRAWYYLPLALLFKWPLGFLGALGARALLATRRWGRRRGELFPLLTTLALLLAVTFALTLYIGIRYAFPLVPLLCVWLGGLAPALVRVVPRARAVARRWAIAGVALAGLQAAEVTAAAPWYLSFFNLPSGGPGGGFRLINDSNVDWGQGLIALREEMQRRGIPRVHLSYHGTTDPGVYGIDYIPYAGGELGPQSEWLAVSSYYYVGLWQRMTIAAGRTRSIRIDFQGLWGTPPVATPAGCMYLFRIPRAPTPP